MLLTPADLKARGPYRPDVCVVGTGFAGYEAAKAALQAGLEVLLIESGLSTFEADIQAFSAVAFEGSPLNRSGEFNADLPGFYRGLPAVRELGGTSNAWSGKWKRLDRLDLMERPWVADSGWPIAWEELEPLCGELWRDYVATPFATPEEPHASFGLSASGHFEQAAPVRLKDKVLELARRPNATLCAGLTATGLEFEPWGGGARVARLRTRSSRDGDEHVVEAEQFVLALGGLETPRLLLASMRRAEAAGLNRHDVVGRFYMDHPKIERKVSLGLLRGAPEFGDPRPGYFRGLRLSDAVQREARTLNHALYVHRRRRPVRGDRVTFRLYLEQPPMRDSRVRLGEGVDRLGLPEIVVEPRFGDGAEEELRRFLKAMGERLARLGLKTLPIDAAMLDRGEFATGNHHMGALRMAKRPEAGAVTPDCQVFGTTNLHVAGSSVFPTSGNANPTLTLAALARRLGRRLAAFRP